MSCFKLVWQLTHSLTAAISLLIEVFGVRIIKSGKRKTTAQLTFIILFNLKTIFLQIERLKTRKRLQHLWRRERQCNVCHQEFPRHEMLTA